MRRVKAYEINSNNFKYIARIKAEDKLSANCFNSFLNEYNERYSNANISGKIKKRKNKDITNFTYEISVDRKIVLNTVLYELLENHLEMTDPTQPEYKEYFLSVKRAIVSTCEKVHSASLPYFTDCKVEELEESLNDVEKIVYEELFKCVDSIIDDFYFDTFGSALCSIIPYKN